MMLSVLTVLNVNYDHNNFTKTFVILHLDNYISFGIEKKLNLADN